MFVAMPRLQLIIAASDDVVSDSPLARYEDADTARQVRRVIVDDDYGPGEKEGQAIKRFSEIRCFAGVVWPEWIALSDLRTTFPHLVRLSLDSGMPDVFDVAGLSQLTITSLGGPGHQDFMALSASLRSLTIGPDYDPEEEYPDGEAHADPERGLLLLIRSSATLEFLSWRCPYSIEIQGAFVGRPAGVLRTVLLEKIWQSAWDDEADFAAILDALPSSTRELNMTFVHPAPELQQGLGDSLMRRVTDTSTYLPALTQLTVGPCGAAYDTEDVRQRARESAHARGVDLIFK